MATRQSGKASRVGGNTPMQNVQNGAQSGTPGNPNDPWSLSSNSYALTNFYIRATDGNGHDSVIQTKVSPALLAQMQHVIQTRSVPQYRTNADIVRDALIHRLRWLHDEYDPTIDLHSLEIEQRQAQIDNLRTERASWEKLLADLEKQLSDLIGYNELDEAEWLIEQNMENEAMTPPFLLRLNKILSKYRAEVKSIRKSALDAAGRK